MAGIGISPKPVVKWLRRSVLESLAPSDITDNLIQQHLSIGDLPMPDLMIRTAGEQRISNFMLWHLAIPNCIFSRLLADSMRREMGQALQAYAGRKRRFGQTDDQIASVSSEQ